MEATSACSSPGIVGGGHQTAKRKFFQWAVKWFYANMTEDTLEKPDAAVLVCLLQSIGFQLRELVKIDESNGNKEKTKANNGTLKVIVECGTSGMRACLELNDVKCKCPNSKDAKDASFWSVSGTGPKTTTKVETGNRIVESGSNLLPPVSKETSKILHDVTYHLLNIIVDKLSDVNQNCHDRSNMNLSSMFNAKDANDRVEAEKFKNVSTSIVRSYTQPEILLPDAITRRTNWTAQQFDKKWSGNLDVEIMDNDQPRPSPPKIASSPVFMNQLCSSLGQISLQSEEDAGNVAEHVIRARKNLDKALEILMLKKSPSSFNSSIHEQGTFLKPAAGGLNLTGGGTRRLSSNSNTSLRSPTGSSRSRLNSVCSLPARETPVSRAKTNLAFTTKSSQSSLTRRSVGSALSTSTNAITSVIPTKRNSNVEQSSATSKIPGRRKSFGVSSSQPLKIAASTARTTAIGLKKKSPESKANTNANQTGSQKFGSSISQPAGNLKFGYGKKKSSNV